MHQAGVYLVQTLRAAVRSGSRPFILLSKDSKYPLLCRPRSSDREVFRQIFIDREYSCLDGLVDPGLIVDCGANVGYSAAFFLSRFPTSCVVAVEPDPRNFRLLERNLAPYGDRARLLQSAIWSHAADLVISEAQFRDGRDWATQVRECRAGETPHIRATDIGTLLKETGQERIGILKVDIEGAESVVFASNYESWLAKVDNIVIELHDDAEFGSGSATFHAAIARCGYSVTTSGELTVCRTPHTKHRT